MSDRLRDRFDLAELVRGVDLLAQVAQEVLLARDAHEVRVGVTVAHVVERVFVAQLLIAGLQVDARVVGFRRADVLVVVAVIDVDVRAAERVDDFDEAREVDVDDAVELQFREDFAFDRLRREHACAADAPELGAERVRRVDLFFRVHARCGCRCRPSDHAGSTAPRSGADRGRSAPAGSCRCAASRSVLRCCASRSGGRSRAPETSAGPRCIRRCRPGGVVIVFFEDLVREAVDRVQRDGRGRRAAERDDQHAGEQEPLPHAPPQPRRALVIHGVYAPGRS